MEKEASSIESAQKIKCSSCGNINNITSKYCIHCGAILDENLSNQQKTIKCPNCNVENNNSNEYCINCGANLITGEQNSGITSPSDNSKKTKKVDPAYVTLDIMLGIISVALSFYINELIVAFLIIAIITLFFKNARYYGITVLLAYVIAAITIIAFFLLLVGMCAGLA